MENSTHRKRLKSRRPLTHHAQQLVSSVSPQETVKHWTRARWAESWASTTTRLHTFMPTPSNSGQGVGLSRRAWTRLNRLRTGVGRFGANMLRWGLSTSDCCDCGAEQMADHITSGLCPIHRPPEGIHGLIELDVKTRTWLENCALDVWWHTREEEEVRVAVERRRRKKLYLKSNKMVNITLANSLLYQLHTHNMYNKIYNIYNKYTNEKEISRVQNIKLMIINISIHDHRFDIRLWAQNPQLYVGPFHNFIRFLNVVNTLHCLISLSSVFHKTGAKYDILFFP